ncbi:MAG: peptidylprolyl isomerase, partial [Bacteroidota bacterium]
MTATSQRVHSEPADSVVARWGEVEITLDQFRFAYPQFWRTVPAQDSPELRRQVAQRMVEQALIGLKGQAEGQGTSPAFQDRLSRDFERFARTAYLESEVSASLAPITETAVDSALAGKRTRRYVRQLFARSEHDIRRLYARLDTEPFEDVARETIPNRIMASRGGALGWIAWGETDWPIERVLSGLREGEVSEPVESLMGWHVFRVDSVEQTIAFATPDPKERTDTRAEIRNRRLDWAAARHIRGIVWAESLTVDYEVLNRVAEDLGPRLPQNAAESQTRPIVGIAETPPPDLESSIVATYGGRPFTVRQFYRALPDLPRDVFGPNLKPALEIAIRDRIMSDVALEAGYGRAPKVQGKTAWSESTYLYAVTMAAAYDSTEIDLDDYFASRRSRYIDEAKVELRELLVADRDTALALCKRIRDGETFEALAMRYSLRAATRSAGGYLGYRDADQDPMAARAMNMPQGALFAPFETEAGYSCFQVGEKRITYADLDAIRPRVRADAEAERGEALHRSLLPDAY